MPFNSPFSLCVILVLNVQFFRPGFHRPDDAVYAEGASGAERLSPAQPELLERGDERGGRLRRAQPQRVRKKLPGQPFLTCLCCNSLTHPPSFFGSDPESLSASNFLVVQTPGDNVGGPVPPPLPAPPGPSGVASPASSVAPHPPAPFGPSGSAGAGGHHHKTATVVSRLGNVESTYVNNEVSVCADTQYSDL